MTDQKLAIVNVLPSNHILAGTMWAEGRGDGREGNSSVEERIAIGTSIRNRLAHSTAWRAKVGSFKGICLAPEQYSCWNSGSGSNHEALMMLMARLANGQATLDAIFEETLYLANGIMDGVILDRTNGATCYYAPKAMQPPGRVPTQAIDRVTIKIGEQLFYNL